jgi:sugar phosphate isomerase/epimerase
MNLHMRDIDGLMKKFVPFGDGVVDYQGIADALKAVGFAGSIDIEQDKKPEIKASCARYLETMRRCLA